MLLSEAFRVSGLHRFHIAFRLPRTSLFSHTRSSLCSLFRLLSRSLSHLFLRSHFRCFSRSLSRLSCITFCLPLCTPPAQGETPVFPKKTGVWLFPYPYTNLREGPQYPLCMGPFPTWDARLCVLHLIYLLRPRRCRASCCLFSCCSSLNF